MAGTSVSWADLVANTNTSTTTYSHTGLHRRHHPPLPLSRRSTRIGTGPASSTANHHPALPGDGDGERPDGQ